MSERREDLGLAHHAVSRTGVMLSVRALDLQCDDPLAERVARTVNPAHSTDADHAFDAICADHVALAVFAVHDLPRRLFMERARARAIDVRYGPHC